MSSWFTLRQSGGVVSFTPLPQLQNGTWDFLTKIFQNFGPLRDKTWAGTHLPGSEVLLMGTSSDIHLLVQISLIKSLSRILVQHLFSLKLAFVAFFFFFFFLCYFRACGILVNPHSPAKDGTWALSSEDAV